MVYENSVLRSLLRGDLNNRYQETCELYGKPEKKVNQGQANGGNIECTIVWYVHRQRMKSKRMEQPKKTFHQT